MHKNLLWILLLAILPLSSCDPKRVYDDYKSIPNEWNKDSIITFNVKNIDSLQSYNLFINVRNTGEYQYSNLFLIAQIEFPQGKILSDTLEYEMSKPNGEWLGTGFGDIKESKLWYKQGVKFDEGGTYKVNIQQAMRKNGSEKGIDNLKGITEVGFRIENTQK